MADREAPFRHELKYIVSDAQAAAIAVRLSPLMRRDPHVGGTGKYTIRSLYFDDFDNSCYYENENGVDPREKLRIRIYNGSDSRISLECKRKERGKTLKTACRLTRREADVLISGGILPADSGRAEPLAKLTAGILLRRMHPVTIVEYVREPFVCAEGNVRITLDTNISSSSAIGEFFSRDIPLRPIMPTGMQLLEVKYDAFLPDVIYRALSPDGLRQTAFSKFYLCRKFSLQREAYIHEIH